MGRCSGLDFGEIREVREVGLGCLSPTATRPARLGSSNLIRGPLRSYPDCPTVGLLHEMHGFFRCIRPWSLFSSEVGSDPPQVHLFLLLYSPVFDVPRPRVGSTFTRLTFVPSIQSRNCGRWLIKLKGTALSGIEH